MNGLLRTLINPDYDDDPKRSEILDVANLLQVGEFQLLQLAYKDWYREELPEDKIDKIFGEYMFKRIIPIWATFYARDIKKLDKANALNIYDEKYHIYDYEFGEHYNEKERRNRGILYATIVAIIFIASHYMAINYVEDEGSAGFYPPYVERSVVFPELDKDKK